MENVGTGGAADLPSLTQSEWQLELLRGLGAEWGKASGVCAWSALQWYGLATPHPFETGGPSPHRPCVWSWPWACFPLQAACVGAGDTEAMCAGSLEIRLQSRLLPGAVAGHTWAGRGLFLTAPGAQPFRTHC